MPRRYKPIEDCREMVREYASELESGTGNVDGMRSEASTRRYLQDLRWFDGWLDESGIDDVTDVERRDGSRIITSLNEEFNGTTKRYRWDVVFGFFDWLDMMGMVSSNPLEYHNSKKSQMGLTKKSEQSQQMGDEENYAVSVDEVRSMEENVGDPQLRNVLLIRLMFQTGLRRSEVSSLHSDDVIRKSREIRIRKENSKNGKARVVAYQRSLDGLLSSWSDKGRRDQWVSGDDDMPYLFVSTHGNQLAPESINEVVRKAASNAGINRELDYEPANGGKRMKITAHSLRHGFGDYMVHETDASVYEVSKIMGHSSVKVTEDTYLSHEPDAGVDVHHKYGPD